jgi:hypothetical protein
VLIEVVKKSYLCGMKTDIDTYTDYLLVIQAQMSATGLSRLLDGALSYS